MKTKIISAIIIIIVFGILAGLIYINNYILPTKIKSKLIQTLQDWSGQKVNIGKLKYNPIRGIVIQDLIIAKDLKDPSQATLRAKEISFNALILPIIKEKKIIIPVLHIDTPHILLQYKQDKTFNISSLFKKVEGFSETGTFEIFIYKIDASQAVITFQDQNTKPIYTKTLSDLDIGIGLDLPKEIQLLLRGKIIQKVDLPANVNINATYDLAKGAINAKLKLSDLQVNEYSPYYKIIPIEIEILNGLIKDAEIGCVYQDNKLSASGFIKTDDLVLKKDKLSLKGDVNISPEISYSKKTKQLSYKADLFVSRGEFAGLDYLKTAEGISGNIRLQTNKLTFQELQFKTLGSYFNLTGSLEDFNKPVLSLTLLSDQIKLEDITRAFPNIGILTTYIKEPIKNINYEFTLLPDELDIKNLSLDYKDVAYKLSGKILNFDRPKLNLKLSSEELDIDSEIKIVKDIIKINSFQANLSEGNLGLTGEINTQDKNNPSVDINFYLNTNPKNILNWLPDNVRSALDKAKIDGLCNFTGYIDGKLRDFKNWNAVIKLISPSLSIYNLSLHNVFADLEQNNRVLKLRRLRAKYYYGSLLLDAVSNLEPVDPPYDIRFKMSNIDIAKVKNDLGLQTKDISGTLNLKAALLGTIKDLNNLNGEGVISIKEGRLWDLNLFRGFAELLFLPVYKKIIFKEGNANFVIKNKSIYTDNLKLNSDELDLTGEGYIDFDGKIDFALKPDIAKSLLKESKDPRRFTTILAGGILVSRITGTLKNPKHSLSSLPFEKIRKIKNSLLNKKK